MFLVVVVLGGGGSGHHVGEIARKAAVSSSSYDEMGFVLCGGGAADVTHVATLPAERLGRRGCRVCSCMLFAVVVMVVVAADYIAVVRNKAVPETS